MQIPSTYCIWAYNDYSLESASATWFGWGAICAYWRALCKNVVVIHYLYCINCLINFFLNQPLSDLGLLTEVTPIYLIVGTIIQRHTAVLITVDLLYQAVNVSKKLHCSEMGLELTLHAFYNLYEEFSMNI